ncbi:MAG: XdhC family protein [Gordonia sp. (in: high G+C Gram-positive bacteria)]
MREQLAQVERWWEGGMPVGLATVVSTFSSAPMPVGSVMAVAGDGRVIGSVSGGCVESAVYAECRDAIETGRPRTERYGVSDDDAFAAGLTCGGTIDVFVQRLDAQRCPGLGELTGLVADDRPAALATVTRGSVGVARGASITIGDDGVWGSTGVPALDAVMVDDVRALLHHVDGGVRRRWSSPDRGAGGEWAEVFVRVFRPRPRLLVFGATDFAVALTGAGAFLGHDVTLCDARPVFAAEHRFPAADRVIRRWPHDYLADQLAAGRIDGRTAICVLTHDERFDVPLLRLALRSGRAGYVGAMGSRRTHDRRMRALRDAGLDDAALSRLRSPIGLDLQAGTPQETAVSIVAEIIADREGGSGRRLSESAGAIHRRSESQPEGVSTSSPEARSPHSTPSTVRADR